MDIIAESGRTLKRMLSFERKRVYLFEEGQEKNTRLFGQKGAALVELTKLGLPVPPGFIITTENFLEYVNHGEEIKTDLIKAYTTAIHLLEKKTGRNFGRPSDDGQKLPLLLAIRAGTAIIVPGVMDTILNVGMSDTVVEYLIQLNPGLQHFALDLHRRFLYQYGILVLRLSSTKYERILTEARERDGVLSNDKLTVDGLTFVVSEFRRFTSVPDDPYEQLRSVIEAMYRHSYSPKVSQSLDEFSTGAPQIPRALAITVQSMVYGNLNKDSGSGVAFSRRPGGGDSVPVGEFLANAEGKEVLDGKRKPTPFEDLMIDMPVVYEDLIRYMRLLEKHDEAIQYIEFTVEDGQLYILETSSVNLRPNMIDSRYVVYYELLLHLQEEEEQLEDKLEHTHHEDMKNPTHELKYDDFIPHHSTSHDSSDAKQQQQQQHESKDDDRLSLDEVLDHECERMSTKSRKHK